MAGAEPDVVGDQHIAGGERLGREEAQEMLHRLGQRADEARDALGGLDQRLARLVGDHAGEIVAFAHQRGERRAHHRHRRLVDRRDQAPPKEFQFNGIKGAGHHFASAKIDPSASRRAVALVPTMKVLSSSSNTAGPSMLTPGASAYRFHTLVCIVLPSSGKNTGRVPFSAPEAAWRVSASLPPVPGIGALTDRRTATNWIAAPGGTRANSAL